MTPYVVEMADKCACLNAVDLAVDMLASLSVKETAELEIGLLCSRYCSESKHQQIVALKGLKEQKVWLEEATEEEVSVDCLYWVDCKCTVVLAHVVVLWLCLLPTPFVIDNIESFLTLFVCFPCPSEHWFRRGSCSFVHYCETVWQSSDHRTQVHTLRKL